jgi:hypothetical protein
MLLLNILKARDLARDDLIRVLTGRSGDAVNWLQNKFALDLSKVSRLGGHSQPRTHRGDAQFPGMVRLWFCCLEVYYDLRLFNQGYHVRSDGASRGFGRLGSRAS